MNVLIWATTFGADLWSLTRSLAERRQRGENIDLRIILDDPKSFAREGVAHLFPLGIPIVRRRPIHHLVGLPGFCPDITIMDNRVPLFGPSQKGFMLWHGFGWKGPNDRSEFRVLHANIRRAFGDPLVPNRRFRWSCFGPSDFKHRTEISCFPPENCCLVGAASHDDLRTPFDKAFARDFYPFDIMNRPTVLFAPTWHYGDVFQHWGSDVELFERLFSHLARREANVILRLHDSYRFNQKYRTSLEDLTRRHPHVLLKYKDKNPDNFLDLQVADVLITNYSSIANLFYATLRPTIHIYPVRDADETFLWRTYTVLGVQKTPVANARFVWKLPPEDHGGLLVRDFDALLLGLNRALDEPACCKDVARSFLDRHMLGADGRNCERILTALKELHDA